MGMHPAMEHKLAVPTLSNFNPMGGPDCQEVAEIFEGHRERWDENDRVLGKQWDH
jgi:hypothetical protein